MQRHRLVHAPQISYALSQVRPARSNYQHIPMRAEKRGLWLIGDVGATHTRVGLVDVAGDALSHLAVYLNSGFTGLKALLRTYLQETRGRCPANAILAVAAPVAGDEVQMVNLAWGFSREGLRRALGLERLEVMNDFTAIAWSLPQLGLGDRCPIGSPTEGPRGTLGVLGPGTGLGVSALVPNGDGWMPIATEGGHVTLPAMNDDEAAVVGDLRSQFGHCSAERVLSGPGLVALYGSLRRLAGHEPDHDSSVPTPEVVTARALSGEDVYAVQAFALFFRFLGTVASNLALSLGARGGIYLAGGILPRIAGALMASDFRARFADKGRYRAYLEAIPIFLITHPHPALLGLRDAILKHSQNINPT